MIDLGSERVSMRNTGPAVGGTTIISNVDPDNIHQVMVRLNMQLGR